MSRMPAPEATDDAVASISPSLLQPVRPLPEFAAELRRRYDRVRDGAERARLAGMILAVEGEIGLRQRRAPAAA
jgi:hypothetical protein